MPFSKLAWNDGNIALGGVETSFTFNSKPRMPPLFLRLRVARVGANDFCYLFGESNQQPCFACALFVCF